VNIVRRVLVGLQATGVRDVYFMPEHFGIVPRAAREAKLDLNVSPLDITAFGEAGDSTRAARRLSEQGVGCIVTLGGDGTNRVVARGCGDVPLAPISTGTNNAFPTMIDGTLAGMAAGLVASGLMPPEVAPRSKWLELWLNDKPVDMALVDVVISRERFIAARAIWDVRPVTDLVLALAEPGSLGFSAIGANLDPVSREEASGLHVVLGGDRSTVQAPIGPGLIRDVAIREWHRIQPGIRIKLQNHGGVVALDGEKEYELQISDRIEVALRLDGPRRVDVRGTLAHAARQGYMRRDKPVGVARTEKS
jgi:predicted polyphosphate/ATP-dependent NAD kinase